MPSTMSMKFKCGSDDGESLEEEDEELLSDDYGDEDDEEEGQI